MSVNVYLTEEKITYAYNMGNTFVVEWSGVHLSITKAQLEELVAMITTLNEGDSFYNKTYFRVGASA